VGWSALQFLDIPCVSLASGHHDLVPNLNLLVFGFLPHIKVSLVLLHGSLVSLPGRLVLAVGLGFQ